MKVNICKSSIPLMLNLIKKLKKEGVVDKEELEHILNHEDYLMEFSRYEGRISKSEYIDYFLNFPFLNEEDIKNRGLKMHHKYYMHLYDNLSFFESKLDILNIDQDTIQKQVTIAENGLPDDLDLNEINMVFTIGIGQSFGYAYKNNIHMDYIQLLNEKSNFDIGSTIAHEIHHVAIYSLLDKITSQELTLEELFYIHFSSEGLAVKYCNNAEGRLSKSIYDGPKNVALDAYTWEYLNNDFENTISRFQQVVKDIRSQKISTEEGLNHEILSYWMNPYKEGQSKDEIPGLLHFRFYSLGNDIWGIIHDVFGKDKVYDTLKNPSQFRAVYNEALDKIGKPEYKI